MFALGVLAIWLERVRSPLVRMVAFWSVPALGTATLVIGSLMTQPGIIYLAILTVIAQSIIVVLAWRWGLCHRPPVFCAPFCWAMALAVVVLLPMQYTDVRWRFNGIPILLVAALLVALISSLMGMIRFALARRRGHGSRHVVWLGSLYFAGCCLPLSILVLHSNRGDYLFIQLLVLYTLTLAGLGLFADTFNEILQRVRYGLAVAVGIVAVGAVLATWIPFRDVGARFGKLSVDSPAGLAAHGLSLAQDKDGDGFYPASIGGNDCDDRSPARHTACEDQSLPELPRFTYTFARPVRHVILLLVDALRGDELEEGIKTGRYPFLSGQTRLACRFTRAYAPGNTTRLSVGPMLTGISPTYFLETKRHAPHDALKALWIFDRLSSDFLSKLLVFSELSWLHQKGQLYDDPAVAEWSTKRTESGHTSPLMADRIIDMLQEIPRQRRLLLVGFTTDPHSHFRCMDGSTGGVRCYREEIQVVDEQLSRIFAAVRANGLLDQTMIIVTSDHGEELGDHGHFGEHGTSLYEEQIRVPLFIWHPDIARRVIETPVSLMGLLTTIADAAHLPVRRPAVYPSLLPLAAGRSPRIPPPLVQHWTGFLVRLPVRMTAMISGDLKLVYDWRSNVSRLYRLSHSSEDLVTDDEQVRHLTEQLMAWHARANRLSHQAHLGP